MFQDEELEQECEEDILEAEIGRQPNQVKPANIKMHCRSRVSWSSSQDKDARIFYRGDKVHKDKTLEGSGHPGENKVEKSSEHPGENKVDKSSEHLGESKAEQKFVFANGSGHPGEKRKENLVDVQLEGSGRICNYNETMLITFFLL